MTPLIGGAKPVFIAAVDTGEDYSRGYDATIVPAALQLISQIPNSGGPWEKTRSFGR